MQLSCKRHWIAGTRLDASCRKCSPPLSKNETVDKPKSVGHFFETTSQRTSTVPVAKVGVSRPTAPTTAGSERAQGKRSEMRALLGPASPSAPQARKRCAGCGRDAMRSTVWGLALCQWCGERVNDVVATGVCTGVEFTIVTCALVQWLREMPPKLRGAP